MDDGSVRQLKAIMFTDIKGFSLMMGQDEELTVRLVREHRELVREVLAKHSGTERQTIGDAFMVLFDSAVNAVRCAVEIQTRMRDANQARPEVERVWLRIGIHLGDIIIDEHEIYGDGVNIAARVEPQAEPGGICITQQVFHQIESKLDCRVIHIGRRELKNIRNAPDLYQVIVDQVGELEGAPSTMASGRAQVVEQANAWPAQPLWKHLVWWLLALSYPVAILARTVMPGGMTFWRDTVGDSSTLVVLFVGLVPAGMLVAAYFTSRFWARGTFNVWLQGRYFVAVPAACLALFLYHYVVLRGRLETQVLPVRSYSLISPTLAREIASDLTHSIVLYANSYALDGLLVAYLAFVVLLGYLFFPRGAGGPVFGPRNWSVLGIGLGLMVAAGVLFRGPLAMAGILYVFLYLAWFLCAAAILRSARKEGRPHSTGLRALLSGLVLAAAFASLLSILGFIRMLGICATRFSADMQPLLWKQALLEIAEGHTTARLITLVLFAALAVMLRKGLSWDAAQPRAALIKDVASATVSFALVLLPLATFPDATREMHLALSLPVGGMQPASLKAGAEPSFYIDRRPAVIGRYGRRVYLELSGKDFSADYADPQVLELLAGGKECQSELSASLGDPSAAAPAVCLTAIEARIACEVQGKRLATPEEWDAALAAVKPQEASAAGEVGPPLVRLGIGEWTMRLVHDNPVFEIKGGDAGTDVPTGLSSTAYSRKVGFRCAYVYER